MKAHIICFACDGWNIFFDGNLFRDHLLNFLRIRMFWKIWEHRLYQQVKSVISQVRKFDAIMISLQQLTR